MGMKTALPIWLDVRPSAYPVFNTQRKYGGDDGQCTWPKESCADFDPFGKKIAGNGPVAVALAIEAVDHGYHSSTEDALRLEANLFGLLASTQDMREGMGAFLEKRKADFQGF